MFKRERGCVLWCRWWGSRVWCRRSFELQQVQVCRNARCCLVVEVHGDQHKFISETSFCGRHILYKSVVRASPRLLPCFCGRAPVMASVHNISTFHIWLYSTGLNKPLYTRWNFSKLFSKFENENQINKCVRAEIVSSKISTGSIGCFMKSPQPK